MAKEKSKEDQVQEEDVLTTTDSNEVEEKAPTDSDGGDSESEMSGNPEASVDEEINKVGAEVQRVAAPKETSIGELEIFVKYLAARALSGPEYTAAKELFPNILRD